MEFKYPAEALESILKELRMGKDEFQKLSQSPLIPGGLQSLIDPKDLEQLSQNSDTAWLVLELSLLSGSLGDWQKANEILTPILGKTDLFDEETTERVLLWRIRCLIESNEFSEAIGLCGTFTWSDGNQTHSNYLLGMAFDGLGMRDKAELRYRAVASEDTNYLDVNQRLESLSQNQKRGT